MTGQPLVSFIVPFGGGLAWLRQALASCQAQTEPRWQAVVVDDHSGEPVAQLIDALADPRIQLRRLPAGSTGVAAARNLALQAADADLLLTLDADDMALPQRASRCLALLEPTVPQLIYTRVQFMNPAGQPGTPKPWLEPHNPQLLRLINMITNPGTAFTRAAYASAGGYYAPELAMAEDYDLYLRMQAAGVAIRAVDEIHVLYRKHRASLTGGRPGCLHQAIMQVRQGLGVAPFPLQLIARYASPQLWQQLRRSRAQRRLWRDDRWPRSLPQALLGW
ncbi:MAG: glycosyltransferase [Cyanobium sp. LacPavin_0920_WC12_MAG_62_9]|nr:glycosyltransferase [Cyanobium sp. LacPavin_0920_WC12_MAG_62_9]